MMATKIKKGICQQKIYKRLQNRQKRSLVALTHIRYKEQMNKYKSPHAIIIILSLLLLWLTESHSLITSSIHLIVHSHVHIISHSLHLSLWLLLHSHLSVTHLIHTHLLRLWPLLHLIHLSKSHLHRSLLSHTHLWVAHSHLAHAHIHTLLWLLRLSVHSHIVSHCQSTKTRQIRFHLTIRGQIRQIIALLLLLLSSLWIKCGILLFLFTKRIIQIYQTRSHRPSITLLWRCLPH